MSKSNAASLAAEPRWRGQPRRVEVWYATATDRATSTGLWVHYELVAPVQGPAFDHGWAAVFAPDREPRVERFGPFPRGEPAGRRGTWSAVPGHVADAGRLCGSAGSLRWDLTLTGADRPLFTFPAWAWRREVLPGAQVVVTPGARIAGPVEVDGQRLDFDGRGALSHIYGHGNAQRWAWLHADLGESDTLEIVTATSRRPGLRRLPPTDFVQLRRHGVDWPHDSLRAAPRFRARVGLPDWSIVGIAGRHRPRVEVHVPGDGGSDARLRRPRWRHRDVHQQRAGRRRGDARALGRPMGDRPDAVAAGNAHAEVGLRPIDPEVIGDDNSDIDSGGARIRVLARRERSGPCPSSSGEAGTRR